MLWDTPSKQASSRLQLHARMGSLLSLARTVSPGRRSLLVFSSAFIHCSWHFLISVVLSLLLQSSHGWR